MLLRPVKIRSTMKKHLRIGKLIKNKFQPVLLKIKWPYYFWLFQAFLLIQIHIKEMLGIIRSKLTKPVVSQVNASRNIMKYVYPHRKMNDPDGTRGRGQGKYSLRKRDFFRGRPGVCAYFLVYAAFFIAICLKIKAWKQSN